MRLRVGALLLAGVVCLSRGAAAAPILPTANADANALLAALLGTTTGLSGFSATLTGDASASGLFDGNPFGLTGGVVLSTGRVIDLIGPNNNPVSGVDLPPVGPPPGGDVAGDATELTISFTADVLTSLFFNYVFGSEEFDFAGLG